MRFEYKHTREKPPKQQRKPENVEGSHWQGWVAAGIVWPAKPKILTISPLMESVQHSWSKPVVLGWWFLAHHHQLGTLNAKSWATDQIPLNVTFWGQAQQPVLPGPARDSEACSESTGDGFPLDLPLPPVHKRGRDSPGMEAECEWARCPPVSSRPRSHAVASQAASDEWSTARV